MMPRNFSTDAVTTILVTGFLIWVMPMMIGTYTLTILIVYGMLGLSLGLIWGFGGILCFGQAAFFGLGAYTYAIAAINIGESTIPMALAVLVPAIFATLLGAMMFYGRLNDVYLGVITLVVTLILYKFINSTAGPQYVIGKARLGGFNGIPGFQTLNVPGRPDEYIWGDSYFYVCAILMGLVVLLVSAFLRSSFGRIAIGIRENETRMSLMGYDVRARKTVMFAVGAAIAGLAGGSFCELGRNRNTQSVFSRSIGRDNHLVHRRWAGNSSGPDPRCGRSGLPKVFIGTAGRGRQHADHWSDSGSLRSLPAQGNCSGILGAVESELWSPSIGTHSPTTADEKSG